VTHAAGEPPPSGAGRRAAFLDRDGTLIEDRHYLADPASVSLMPGAAAAVRELNKAGMAVVVVTNQSGIARGHFSEADYELVRARVVELFAEAGARIDATYHCPHHPELTGPCACRKPGTLLYERAAAELGLDPARSLYVGDRWRDVAPALALGGVGVLVATPDTPAGDVVRASEEARLATTLKAAVERFLAA
jgi:D-glycero-D-manno-heptose 1,7-bisphosphate phosphatase